MGRGLIRASTWSPYFFADLRPCSLSLTSQTVARQQAGLVQLQLSVMTLCFAIHGDWAIV